MVYKSLNAGCYVGYIQYDSIREFWTAHANVYEALLEGVMNSRYIGKDTREGDLSKYPTRSEWF